MLGLGLEEIVVLAIVCLLIGLAFGAGRRKQSVEDRSGTGPADPPAGRRGWLTRRRVAFFVLAWVMLAMGGMTASREPDPDRRQRQLIGAAFWAAIPLAVALWPRRSR